MWTRFLTIREISRLERALEGAIDAGRREDLKERLGSERLKLLGANAAAVDPARLFHGASLRTDDGGHRRFG
jgi:hypothetical protein